MRPQVIIGDILLQLFIKKKLYFISSASIKYQLFQNT